MCSLFTVAPHLLPSTPSAARTPKYQTAANEGGTAKCKKPVDSLGSPCRRVRRQRDVFCAEKIATVLSMKKLIAVPLLLVSFVSVHAATPWGSIGGYFPGMSKEAAKKIGVQSCEPKSGNVTCQPNAALKIGAISPVTANLVFDERSGVLKKIVLRFRDGTTDSDLDTALAKMYGKSEITGDDSPCGEYDGLVFDDATDITVHTCKATRYGKSVYFKSDPGRGARIKKQQAGIKKNKANASSFNSKP